MFWNEKCLLQLTHHNLFESTEHRDRFRDLIDCYYRATFFSKGMVKCMYLASWDEEHFNELLLMLNQLTISGARSAAFMAENGTDLISSASGFDLEAYRLSYAFLTNTYYRIPDFSQFDADEAHILRQTLLASTYIDDLPDPKSNPDTRKPTGEGYVVT